MTTNFYLSRGIVLPTVLLLLLGITVLVLALLDAGLLETKMTNAYQDKLTAFYAAESTLKQDEEKLLAGVIPKSAQKINANVCGVDFYKLTVATKSTSGANATLQSVFAKVGDTSKCVPKPNVQTGRQSWLEL